MNNNFPIQMIKSSLITLLMCAPALFAGTASGVSTALPSGSDKLKQPQAGYYDFKVGKLDVTALSDGTADIDSAKELRHAKTGEIEKLRADAYATTPESFINTYVIRLADRLILVDTGAGGGVSPSFGKLSSSLRASGIQPDEITDILLSHLHPDHIGGLVAGGKMVFPRAIIHLNKKEFDFWTDEAKEKSTPEPNKFFFVPARAALAPYLSQNRVKTFEDGVEFFPGLRSIPAYGHTPGHTIFALENSGEKLVFWGDLVHSAEAQFDDPLITITYDVSQEQAASVRKVAFTNAAKEGYMVALAHVPFPGIGRLRKVGNHYRWIPARYVNNAVKQ